MRRPEDLNAATHSKLPNPQSPEPPQKFQTAGTKSFYSKMLVPLSCGCCSTIRKTFLPHHRGQLLPQQPPSCPLFYASDLNAALVCQSLFCAVNSCINRSLSISCSSSLNETSSSLANSPCFSAFQSTVSPAMRSSADLTASCRSALALSTDCWKVCLSSSCRLLISVICESCCARCFSRIWLYKAT